MWLFSTTHFQHDSHQLFCVSIQDGTWYLLLFSVRAEMLNVNRQNVT